MLIREQYGPVNKLENRHFLVGPEMGEEFEVTIEKGKTLTIKTLTPGIEVCIAASRTNIIHCDIQEFSKAKLDSLVVRNHEDLIRVLAVQTIHTHCHFY